MNAPGNDDNAALPGGLDNVVAAAICGAHPPGRPDWKQLLPLLARHQLDAWLFDIVANWPAPLQPDPQTLDAWAARQRARVIAAVQRQAQLAQVLAALYDANIPVIPLKGAWLAEHVYADIAQRPMSDHDLLIHPEHAAAAQDILRDLGYTVPMASSPQGWAKEVILEHPRWRHGLELQWSLWHESHNLPRQEMARLWQISLPATVAGVPVLALPPAAHIAYLAYHIQAHQWHVTIRAHLDIVLALRHFAASLCAAELSAEAQAWQLPFSIPFGWRAAHAICGVASPPQLPGTAHKASDEAAQISLLCQTTRNIFTLPEKMPRLLSQYQQAPRWQRLPILLRAAFPPPAKIRFLHQGAVRCAGLAGGYAARLADLLQRRRHQIMPGALRDTAALAGAAALQQLENWLRTRDAAGGRE